ncbi:4Fe-4S dicluster domain-containing protein [Labilithrix luteola]|nr:4Fe-4S dicluster domain-containing protein [Labilithrix luteola]
MSHDTGHRASALARMLDETRDPIARRDFLVRMSAALGLAGVTGCTRAPREQIVPYVVQPPEVTPGKPTSYASATVLDGYATGVLVESHEGRPTKVEGNPEHPASLGASSAFDQASVLSLYDPSRAQAVKQGGSTSTWQDVATAIASGPWTAMGGKGLHLVMAPTSSPTAAILLKEIRERYPNAAISFHAPASRRNAWQGARLAYGKVVEPRFDLRAADVIVALDADFLGHGPAQLRLSRQFADRRRLARHEDGMNRLYAVDSLLSVTGASADHRLRVGRSEVMAFAAMLFAAIASGKVPQEAAEIAAPHRRWVEAVIRDLLAHRRRSLVIAGDTQPAVVHAMAHAINTALGNVGTTVTFGPSPIIEAGEPSHGHLADALENSAADTVIVLGANAVYASPAERPIAPILARARNSAYVGLYDDETARVCLTTIAEAHPLESWGDARAFDGTVSIIQPLVDPLFGGRSVLDVLAVLAGRKQTNAYDLVRERFKNDPARFRRALRRGFEEGSAFDVVTDLSSPDLATIGTVLASSFVRAERHRPTPEVEHGFDLVLTTDPHTYDGRFANDAWLLELPSPIGKLTWTNAATLSVEAAAALDLASGDEVEIRAGERSVRVPALVVPGQATGTVGLSLGWGRTAGAELSAGLGANAYELRPADEAWHVPDVTVRKTGERHVLPITQIHQGLEGRDESIARHATLSAWTSREPKSKESKPKRPLSIFNPPTMPAKRQWGMAVDLAVCTGCSACVVACQAENNVPTVGADGVRLGRAMHWLRIDAYAVGSHDFPRMVTEPMLCQHCEKAPCEYVCPVNATVHSEDGLNQMVYNRCVGTRFCSNNCPYKVRRFNWFDFHRTETPKEQLVHNPDVTVRERGVMEKCTFCVQRIREYEISERVEPNAPRKPLQTACQQACPTGAIVFGDVADRESEVAKLHRNERAFAVLDELGTVPRVRYLAKIINDNPELEEGKR